MLVEIRVAEKSSPNEKSDVEAFGGKPRIQNAPNRSQGAARRAAPAGACPGVRDRYPEDHRLVFASVLGMRLSDRSGDMIAFMHGIHGSDHHMIAFVKSDGPGLHHLSWDVASINDIGLGASHMADKGFSRGWGLGRHVLGSNFFHYVRDPWGSYAEYSSDIDYVPVDYDWQAQDHPREDSFYVWGPTPPEDSRSITKS